MKAIETIYKGHKFRSRLEARWAVFFDELGWIWEYEKEGYVLEGGIPYLPDFWLPEIGVWVEVKPDVPTVDDMKKCLLFSKGLPDNQFITMVNGLPEPISYLTWHQGEEVVSITFTTYVRSKNWRTPYFGDFWVEEDMPAFEKARMSRFEFGQKG